MVERLVVVEELEIVEIEHRAVSAGEVVAIFTCRANDKDIIGHTVGGFVFKIEFKLCPLSLVGAPLEIAVGDHVGGVRVEKLAVGGVCADFERLIRVDKGDPNDTCVGAAFEVVEPGRGGADGSGMVFVISQLSGALRELAAEAQDAVGAVGFDIFSGKDVAGSEFAHDTDTDEFCFEHSR